MRLGPSSWRLESADRIVVLPGLRAPRACPRREPRRPTPAASLAVYSVHVQRDMSRVPTTHDSASGATGPGGGQGRTRVMSHDSTGRARSRTLWQDVVSRGVQRQARRCTGEGAALTGGPRPVVHTFQAASVAASMQPAQCSSRPAHPALYGAPSSSKRAMRSTAPREARRNWWLAADQSEPQPWVPQRRGSPQQTTGSASRASAHCSAIGMYDRLKCCARALPCGTGDRSSAALENVRLSTV